MARKQQLLIDLEVIARVEAYKCRHVQLQAIDNGLGQYRCCCPKKQPFKVFSLVLFPKSLLANPIQHFCVNSSLRGEIGQTAIFNRTIAVSSGSTGKIEPDARDVVRI